MIALISWLAMFVTLYGIYLIAKKNKWGWVVGMMSCVLWIVYATVTRQPALIATNFVILAADLYGAYQWTK